MKKIVKILFLTLLKFKCLFTADITITLKNLSGVDTKLFRNHYYTNYTLDDAQRIEVDFGKDAILVLTKIDKTIPTKVIDYIIAYVPDVDDASAKFSSNGVNKSITLHLIVNDKKLQFVEVKKTLQQLIDESKTKDDNKENDKSTNKKLEPDG